MLPVKVFALSGISIFISFISGASVSGSIIFAIIIAAGTDKTVAPTKWPAIVGILSLRSDTYNANIEEAIVDIKTVKIKNNCDLVIERKYGLILVKDSIPTNMLLAEHIASTALIPKNFFTNFAIVTMIKGKTLR